MTDEGGDPARTERQRRQSRTRPDDAAIRDAMRMAEIAQEAAHSQMYLNAPPAPSPQKYMLQEQRATNELLVQTTDAVKALADAQRQVADAQAGTDRRMLRLTIAILVLTALGVVIGFVALVSA